jgi:membrane-associated phospholipid phosphatase
MFKITEKNYKRIITFFKERNFACNALKFCYRFLPLLLFIGYPALIVYVFFSNPVDLFKIILVPLGVFLLVTVLRKVINEQRPYEKYRTSSLFGKTTKGQSMPSRHTASAFIISLAIFYVNAELGIAALTVSFLITLSRVLAGVHFIRDVVVSILLSVTAGTLFFFII